MAACWGVGDRLPFHPLILQFYILRRNIRAKFIRKKARHRTADELCRQRSFFHVDDGRFIASDFPPPPVIVVDDFYDDPDSVRKLALETDYVPYGRYWFASALWVKTGAALDGGDYFHGFRHNDASVVEKLSKCVMAEIDMETWETMGDGWNGAFHYKLNNTLTGGDGIHHHWKPLDVAYGWSGLVYLSDDDDPSPDNGTSIWRDLETGKCVAKDHDAFFDRNVEAKRWEKVLDVQPKFNRLVLFRCDVFHQAGWGFGDSLSNARLFQTFFFSVRKSRR